MKIGTTTRFNGTHRKGPLACGGRFSVLLTYCWEPGRIRDGKAVEQNFWRAEDGREFEVGNGVIVYTCSCGRKRYAEPVRGRFNPGKLCNDKCQAATGHDCECSCGGKNHGAAHAA
jgi:hypothetical protein